MITTMIVPSVFAFVFGLARSLMPCEHMSQSGESKIIYDRFFSKPAPLRNGVFFEAGGLDGKLYSNSWFFERCLGWTGLLVEGNPANYNQIKANRPSTIALHQAICREEKRVDFTISGGAIAGSMSHMPGSFLRQWHGQMHPKTVSVYCGPLAHALCLLGITEIDFFSLDVEGAELEAIESIDFSRVNIHVMIVEADEHNRTKNERVREHMFANGFVCEQGVVERSDLFVNSKWPLPAKINRPCHSYDF